MTVIDRTFSELESRLKVAEEVEQNLADIKKELGRSEQVRSELLQQNKLLLLQVHHLQEELESVSVEKRASEVSLKKLQDWEVEASELSAQQGKELESVQKQLSQEKIARKLQVRLVEKLQQQLREVLSQKNDQVILLAQQSQKNNDLLAREVSQTGLLDELKDKKNNLNKELEKRISELEKYRQALKAAEESNNDKVETIGVLIDKSERESELLHLQLSQIQKELECYHQKYLEMQSVQSVLESLPYFAEKVELLGYYENGQYRETRWVAKGVHQRGRNKLSSLHFKFVDNDGVPALVIRPETDEEKRALVWPEEMRDEYGDRLLIKLEQGKGQAVLNELLSAWDFQLVVGFTDSVQSALMANALGDFDGAKSFDRSGWLKLILSFKNFLASNSSVARFNSAKIREVHTEVGYERLWVDLSGLQCSEVIFDRYHFKLVLKGGHESGMPDTVALVLRELDSGRAPLQVWPPDTYDGFGPVLSIEFDLKTGKPKSEAQLLAVEDVVFIKCLLAMIPLQLKHVVSRGQVLGKYSLSEWRSFLSVLNLDEMQFGLGLSSEQDVREVATEPRLKWGGVKLYENHRKERYAHLGIRVYDLKFGDMFWSEYDFKFFARKINEKMDGSWGGLEFRVMKNGDFPLFDWPPSNVVHDEFGDVALIDKNYSDYCRSDLDRALIGNVISALPDWLDTIGESTPDVDPGWPVWDLLLQRLQSNG